MNLRSIFKDINLSIVLILLGVFVVGFSVTYFSLNYVKKNPISVLPTPNAFDNATPAPVNEVVPQKGVYNFLLLGFGGAGHSGSLLTDSIIIVHVDSNSHKILLVTVPRDLWVPSGHKINAAGVQTGFQNVGTELTNVTGLPFNYYVAVDFGNFVKLIDDLGGITVTAPNTFDDPFYPILGQENNTCGKTEAEINALKAQYTEFNLEKQFTCRYEHIHYDKGQTYNMDGATTLKFVRSRHGDSDFGRSLRQLAVLKGMEDKLISFQTANHLNDIIDTLLKIVRTDLDAGVIKTLVDVLGSPKNYSINQIQLSEDNVLTSSKSSEGAFILIPKIGNFNFTDIKSLIKESE